MKTKLSPEKEFLDELNMFRNEVISALKSVYAEQALHEIVSKDKKALDVLNMTPTFWNTVLSAFQNSTFTTFGRIFDNNGKSSIRILGKITRKNRDIFTKSSFSSRWGKEDNGTGVSSWLPEYLKNLYVPVDKDFDDLDSFIAKMTASYKDVYLPIRDHFGHRLYKDNMEINKLFEKVNIRKLEKFCTQLEALHQSLWQLYHNGRGPIFPLKKGGYSTKNILKKKYKPYERMPTNTQIIEEVNSMIKLLKSGKKT